MFKKTTIATCVAMFCYSQLAVANENTTQLAEITVTDSQSSDVVQSTVSRQTIEQKQAHNIKDVLSEQLDTSVTAAPSTRSGNDGVNLRGLSGNRVATTIDGINMPEAQEAKHFISYGMEFGRGDYIEPTGLRGAEVSYGGSANSLSGSVNFSTLEAGDLLKGRKAGGFVGTGFNSVDTSTYGTAGVAVEADRYQGMVMTTLRRGHETKTHGDIGGTGDTRTEADQAKYRNTYVLTKHQYQVDDNNSLKFTYEYLFKRTDTDLLSKTGTSIDSGTGTQISGEATDHIKRNRFALQHEYSNENGWLQNAKTQLYYQKAETENERDRQSATNYRHESSNVQTKTYGLKTDLRSDINSAVPQSLRYGFHLNRTDVENYLSYQRPAYSVFPYSMFGKSNYSGKPAADTRKTQFDLYVEDQLTFGDVVVTPTLGFVHYRVNPKSASNVINDTEYNVSGFDATKKTHQTIFTPKLSVVWKLLPEFEPYFQYSRGVRTPSGQQLSSFFYESVFGQNVAVVGNPNLKAETAHNFEVGFKGQNDRLQYLVTGYYNKYKNFIDWRDLTSSTSGYLQYLQYQNLDKAKIYGTTAHAKWKFFDDYFVNAGLAYARGKATNEGVKTPINSVQPLKTRLGFGYEGELFGANLQWTYNRGKADKDIYSASSRSTFYNPTGGYSVFDFGLYWKPLKDLTLTANVNNIFNKKYWNWNDISYLALMKGQVNTATNAPIGINATNADRYTAPGRNFNVGVRYEF